MSAWAFVRCLLGWHAPSDPYVHTTRLTACALERDVYYCMHCGKEL